ncbi:MAG: 4Fe-4S dicluster domain-containing protein [Desulfovibrionales bacterium]
MSTTSTQYALPKSGLADFIETLARDYDCFGPVRSNGKTVWARIADPGALDLQTLPTDLSPKAVFFPQTETLMRFDNRPGHPETGVMKEEKGPDRPVALIGIRPCDARAFRLLDDIFCPDEESCDPYWSRRRKDALLVGLACDSPGPACFCTAVGGGPFDPHGLDLLLTDLDDKYLVSPVSDRGASLAQELDPAGREDLDRAEAMQERARICLPEENLAAQVADRDLDALYGSKIWERIAETCLNCGACTFSCPTCHCFDIQDEVQGPKGRRLRVWDTCMSPLFTRHASGHNPRGTKADRVRQRFLHKLKYIPMKQAGKIGCVGCGRCVLQCPVNIDIREVIQALDRAGEEATQESAT